MSYLLIVLAAATRLLPHPPNFAPIGAMALFGGRELSGWRAFAFPLAAMLASDLFIGFYTWKVMLSVYGSFALQVVIGRWLRSRPGVFPIVWGAFLGAVLFYLITNWAVWAFTPLYPKTAGGLLASYIAALPFFRNTLMGNLFYAGALFGGYALWQRSLPWGTTHAPSVKRSVLGGFELARPYWWAIRRRSRR